MYQKYSRCILSFAILISTNIYPTKPCTTNSLAISQNTIQPHAFSSYLSQELMMFQDFYAELSHPEYTESQDYHWIGTFSAATEYMHSFGCSSNTRLGATPFWSGSNKMTIGTNNGQSDLDAYQFGMGNVIKQGDIAFEPSITHVGTNFLLYMSHYNNRQGGYFKVKAPLGAMIVTSKLKEHAATLDNSVDTAWISQPAPDNRYHTLSQALHGGSFQTSSITTEQQGSEIVSSIHKPIALEYGRVADPKETTIRLADLTVSVGYNFLCTKNRFISCGVKMSAPTGNVPTAQHMLEPIFGRAGHWGAGVEFFARHQFNIHEDLAVDFSVDSEVMHLFSGRKPSWRSFDLLQNGPGSKYLLLQFYYPGNPSTLNPTGRVGSFITQAINFTTLPVISTFDIEGSVAAMMNVQYKNWDSSIVAEFWGRSREKLKIDGSNALKFRAANLNDFAVLGRQISEDARFTPAYPLDLCDPLARINKSENRVLASGTNFALPGSAPAPYNTSAIKDARISENRIPSSYRQALDIAGAEARKVFTGKITGQCGYTWKGHHHLPRLSLFGAVELTNKFSNLPNIWSAGVTASCTF